MNREESCTGLLHSQPEEDDKAAGAGGKPAKTDEDVETLAPGAADASLMVAEGRAWPPERRTALSLVRGGDRRLGEDPSGGVPSGSVNHGLTISAGTQNGQSSIDISGRKNIRRARAEVMQFVAEAEEPQLWVIFELVEQLKTLGADFPCTLLVRVEP